MKNCLINQVIGQFSPLLGLSLESLTDIEKEVLCLFYEERKAAYLQMKYHNLTPEKHTEISNFIHNGHNYKTFLLSGSTYRKLLLDLPDLRLSSQVMANYYKDSLLYGDKLHHVDLSLLYSHCYPYLTFMDMDQVVFPLSESLYRDIALLVYKHRDEMDAIPHFNLSRYWKGLNQDEPSDAFYQKRLSLYQGLIRSLASDNHPLVHAALYSILSPASIFDVFLQGESLTSTGNLNPLVDQIKTIKRKLETHFNIEAHMRTVSLRQMASSLFLIHHFDSIIHSLYNQETMMDWLTEEQYVSNTFSHLSDLQQSMIADLKNDWGF